MHWELCAECTGSCDSARGSGTRRVRRALWNASKVPLAMAAAASFLLLLLYAVVSYLHPHTHEAAVGRAFVVHKRTEHGMNWRV